MTASPHNILVIRNDRLGDFMLIYPALSLIKNLFPAAKVTALLPEYTRPMAELCPWIDSIIVEPPLSRIRDALQLASSLRAQRFDAVIDFHPQTYTALAVYLSGIKHRYAPASRLVQLFYNHRLVQRRSKSARPEFEYNLELAGYMSESLPAAENASPASPPYLVVPRQQRERIRADYCRAASIDENRKLVMVHPGSGGSALNLKLEDYAQLIKLLAADPSLFFIITAGPGEEAAASAMAQLIGDCPHDIHISSDGLTSFTEFLSIAFIYISGSTGVLHIAGALDVPTVAFYPAKRSATALRWRTLNNSNNRLAFTSVDAAGDSINVNITECYQQIKAGFLRNNHNRTS